MSVPKICFELVDGYTDKSGVCHRDVTMSPLTPEIQISLRSDQRIRELRKSALDMNSRNQVERSEAFGELQEYYCVMFGKTVEAIGQLPREQLVAERIHYKLTARDIGVMMMHQNGGGSTLVRLDRVKEIINASALSEADRIALLQYLETELGEAPPASAA
jgi:hypothetical protein